MLVEEKQNLLFKNADEMYMYTRMYTVQQDLVNTDRCKGSRNLKKNKHDWKWK